jgi:hypothetical protein
MDDHAASDGDDQQDECKCEKHLHLHIWVCPNIPSAQRTGQNAVTAPTSACGHRGPLSGAALVAAPPDPSAIFLSVAGRVTP